ncbi:IS30 family transposase [Aliidiomarina maris]|uniref:IS30 family transposase n=1 Tax=Aliidiomarina maris TaxID=531312 RepID=A0A327X752_9GAMM|nr:IS30 family transposase [Aliidiomarina maris]RAJ99006.1 IS30 family transposase [Aliidiomarina maris]RUO25141.1 IS30 family transposase [Aliidiomarina maris]
MSYRQLTEGQRYQISAFLPQEFSQQQIARRLNVAPSTNHVELRRNKDKTQSYEPGVAQQRTLSRCLKPMLRRICDNTVCAVEFMLQLNWSPEQILAICTRLGYSVSHEWIYNYVRADFNNGGSLFEHLRHKLKRYKRRFDKQRGRILNRRSIHDRPSIIEQRGRYGDWEIDTIIGKQGTGAMVTLLERKSSFYLVKKVSSKQADVVADATIDMVQPFKSLVHSITSDNGKEFAEHQRIARELDTDVYFVDPYASYQRGANENANGLLRQYVPKGTDLRTVTHRQIEAYKARLNERPR